MVRFGHFSPRPASTGFSLPTLDHVPPAPRTSPGEQAAWLLLAAGALTIVNNYLPGSGHLDVALLNLMGGVAVALGAASLVIPWRRLHPRTPLLLVLVAFALIALGDRFGGVSTFSYAVYFIVVFVWVGIGQPPRTAFWLAPVATAAYVAPFLTEDHPPANAVSSVTVAIPVCILVAEVLARSVRHLEQSRAELRHRVDVVERLAGLTGELGKDLDVEAVTRRLVDSAQEIFQARAAVFVAVDGSDVVVTAAAGLPASYVGERIPLAGTRLARAAASDRLVLTGDDEIDQLPAGVGGSALTVACRGTELLGGLTVLLSRAPAEVTDEDRDLIRLLGAQGTAALVNATEHRTLLDQREHEQAVVDVLADGVLVVSPDGVVTSCNSAAAVLLGTTAGDLVGARPPLDLGVPGTPVEREVVPGKWVEALSAVLPATGEIVVAVRDTSRQRALDAAKDLFLATTSHELRTPLTAIKGYVATLQRHWDVLTDTARLDALATIADRTDALVGLTNHLLLGARAGAAAHTAATSPFHLGTVTSTAVQTYRRISDKHHVVAQVPDDLAPALGDPATVQSVLAQLIENAIKYSPGGGVVRVAVAAGPQQHTVEVYDDGVGIPAGQEQSIFTPFYQAAPANTREFGGVGLGLYIVRQLVEAYGGSVAAANRPEGGTVVRFTVPVCPVPQQTGGAHDRPAPHPAGR